MAASARVLPALRRLIVPLEERMARHPSEAGARLALSAWILGLRWLALVVISILVGVAGDLDDRLAPDAIARLWGGLAVLLVVTVAWTLAGPRRAASPWALAAQIGGDAAVVGWLVHAAGGMANPFAGALAFHAILAAVALPRYGRLAAAGVAAFAIALTVVEAAGLAPPLPLGALGDPLTVVQGGAAATALVVGGALLAGSLAASLHRERETLRQVIEGMADAVVFADRRGDVVMHNKAAGHLWAGRAASGSLRVCHTDAAWGRLLAKLEDPAEQELHPTLVAGGRSFEASYARVRDASGQLAGVVMVARDVTERLATQEWRMREERLAVVGKLAAGLAHEINNPLGAIALFTRLALREAAPGAALADHLETVLRNADACKRVVKDLLVHARQRPPRREPVAVPELVADVARTLRVAAERAGVALVAEPCAVTVAGDPDQLRQVLVNLGLNAIDAMPAGGTLRLGAAAAGAAVRLSVSDTGVGIAPEERERIFAAFYTTKPDGTGLGLAVVKDLVEAHRGRVDVESEPGRGTTFTVSLPAEAAA
jgi:signal transduction histidine kinase